jgi:hypothetical protein
MKSVLPKTSPTVKIFAAKDNEKIKVIVIIIIKIIIYFVR